MTNRQSSASSRSVDTLVVGAGLAGLFAAALRAHSGKRVLVAEATNALGGRWSPERRDGFQLGAGLSFADSGMWKEAYSVLDLPCTMLSIENGRAVVYGTKGWLAAEDLPA